jgi:hypothetical protein
MKYKNYRIVKPVTVTVLRIMCSMGNRSSREMIGMQREVCTEQKYLRKADKMLDNR